MNDQHGKLKELKSLPDWVWLPYLVGPLMLGFVVKIFPVDHAVAGAAVAAVLCVLAAIGLSGRCARYPGVLIGAFALTATIISLPFWALRKNEFHETSDVRPVYSYREAKGNPAAFAKWWNFFVDEVVRIQPLIFDRDPSGTPFNGKFPFRPRPSSYADFHEGRIEINNLGYRGSDFSRQKADVFRILTLGDSVTFGQTLFANSRTWSAILEELIGRNLACAKPIHVVNGGVNAFHLRNAVERLRLDYSWLRPDMVLPYFGWNSMEDLGVEPTAAPIPLAPAANERWNVVIWYIVSAARSLQLDVVERGRSAAAELFNPRSDVGFDTTELLGKANRSTLYSDYLSLIEHSRTFGYRLALMTFNTAVAPDGPEEAKAFYQAVTHAVRPLIKKVHIHNTMIENLARSHGVAFVDTGNEIYGRYESDLYLDIVHFSPSGDFVMATNVFRGIRPMLLAEPDLGCRPR